MQDKYCRVLRKLRNWYKEMSLNNKYTVSSWVINWCPKDKGCLVLETKIIYAAWSLNWLVRVLLKSTHIFIFMISTAQDIISGTQYISKCCTVLSNQGGDNPQNRSCSCAVLTVGDAAALFHHAQHFSATPFKRKKNRHTHTHTKWCWEIWQIGMFKECKNIHLRFFSFSVKLPECCKVCLL